MAERGGGGKEEEEEKGEIFEVATLRFSGGLPGLRVDQGGSWGSGKSSTLSHIIGGLTGAYALLRV